MAAVVRFLIRQDPAVPAGGHALLYLQGAGRLPEDAKLVVRRRQPPEDFLAASGWQSVPAELTPEGQRQEADGTPVLLLGPAVVDRIRPHTKVELQVPALGLSQLVVWPALTQSPLGLLPTAAYVAGGSQPGKRASGGIAPPARREPPPLATPAEEPATEEPPAPEPQEPPTPLIVDPPDAPRPAPRRRAASAGSGPGCCSASS